MYIVHYMYIHVHVCVRVWDIGVDKVITTTVAVVTLQVQCVLVYVCRYYTDLELYHWVMI